MKKRENRVGNSEKFQKNFGKLSRSFRLFSWLNLFRELELKKIAMSRMDLETPKEVVAPDDMTAADYYFDSYAHFGKDLSVIRRLSSSVIYYRF